MPPGNWRRSKRSWANSPARSRGCSGSPGPCRRSDGCRECDEKLADWATCRPCRPTLPRTAATRSRGWKRPARPSRTPRREIARLDGQIAALAVPEGLVSRAAEIEAVYKELSVYRKAQADLPGLVAKREHLEKEAAALLHELRPELTLADADQLKLSRRQQVEIQNLGNRKEALEKQLAQARSEIADSQQRLAEASDQLAQLPPPCDPAPLAEAIRAGPQPGQPFATGGRPAGRDCRTHRAGGDRSAQAGALERIAGSLGEAGLARGGNDRPFRSQPLRCPSGDRAAAGQLEKARGDAADIERDLERLRLEGEVPSEAELAEARKLRDAGWRLVLQDWRKEAIDAAALR